MNAHRLKPVRFPWPPVFYSAAIILAFAFGHILYLPLPEGMLLRSAGVVLVLAAIALDGWALATLWRSHTTVMLHRRASHLVTHGPYRFTRNPIYLGYTLATLGIGLTTANPWFFIGAFAAAVFTSARAIRCEEMHLLARFGADYERYCRHTRRWI